MAGTLSAYPHICLYIDWIIAVIGPINYASCVLRVYSYVLRVYSCVLRIIAVISIFHRIVLLQFSMGNIGNSLAEEVSRGLNICSR